MRGNDDQLQAFRNEVIEFLDSEVSDRIREAGRKTTSMFSPFDEAILFQQLLFKKGWSGVSWPVEYGGTGWDIVEQNIFHDECRQRGLPFLLPNALSMVGPAIMRYGTSAQKEKFLPSILAGEGYWTQGYSEPNSGSDLVSLKCRADLDGDHYVVNGSKIWTTFAHLSNQMFMLVKTDLECKPQRGITFLLLESMELPGLEVRPIIGLDGCPEQCEVFFDNVRVPVSSRLGDENDGWSVAKYLLEHERGGSSGFAVHILMELERIKAMAAQQGDGEGGVLIDDAVFQHRYADLFVEAQAVMSVEKKMSTLEMGGAESGYFSSMFKVMWTECLQNICTLAVDVSAELSLPLQLAALVVGSEEAVIGSEEALTVMPKYLNNHAASIYGGTNEIQREIISKAVLANQ